MSNIEKKLSAFGLAIPEVYLPATGTDYEKWAVVACDQYSSEKEYWEDVAKIVGDKPSTLNLIFPECYLEDKGKADRVKNIQSAMKSYLNSGALAKQAPGFVLIERTTPFEKHPRKGLLVSVDLEAYKYGAGVTSLIRPTEGTIVERLPPRMEIRRGAPLELPHIMLLIDDPSRSIIEPLYAKFNKLPLLYNFNLMKKSGHVKGALVNSEADLQAIAEALEKIADAKSFESKYGSKDLLLFAVGDGNHSLATAKAIWEEIKKGGADMSHPARYALVELVNIYDEGLPFHPIHRVLFKANAEKVLADIKNAGGKFVSMPWAEAVKKTDAPANSEHRFAYISDKDSGLITFSKPKAKLAAGTIQPILDAYIKANADTGIDYIHGTDSLEALSKKTGNFGLYLPPIDKSSFFATVIRDGAMPRKTFSMGEAPEKRFYIESRKIIK